MFGSTPVVSVRLSSSDEELEEPARSGVNVRAAGYSHQPAKEAAPRSTETRVNPTTNAQGNTNIANQFTKPNNNTNLEAQRTIESHDKESANITPAQDEEIQHLDADQGRLDNRINFIQQMQLSVCIILFNPNPVNH